VMSVAELTLAKASVETAAMLMTNCFILLFIVSPMDCRLVLTEKIDATNYVVQPDAWYE
jgi:hypothetical protein